MHRVPADGAPVRSDLAVTDRRFTSFSASALAGNIFVVLFGAVLVATQTLADPVRVVT